MSSARSQLTMIRAHLRFSLIDTLRSPISLVMTVLFPSIILAAFSLVQPELRTQAGAATQATAQLAVFSALTVGLCAVGFDTARLRESPWFRYVRILPVRPVVTVLGLLVGNLVLALTSQGVLVLTALIFTPARVTPSHLIAGAAAVVISLIPFILMGITIAYAVPQKAAAAITMPTLFICAALGGLWFSPATLPAAVAQISRVIPTRGPRDLVLGAVLGQPIDLWVAVNIVGWVILLVLSATWLIRRDTGMRYR
ncbi:ABC transporter permease [Klugiella xanthotipulae]|uniref:ABC-2 type transport system permease protein n=1 Tax=Klugiella xanthotipulae TaxID=244735 RepID=A0A543HYT2_9MICO|nr:ABC transporter permease [Klugiella xanthotipulae]TQM63469.1 ABC-2 type transport system permease protein [Klugiella xanthotipulae]